MARTENLQRTARTLLKLSAGFLAAYSVNIEYNARYDSSLRQFVRRFSSDKTTDAKKALERMDNKFFVNSIDEMIKDSLRTGDVIVFTKKWYYCHLHTILARYMYRKTTRYDFDHFGVIIQDKVGDPYVLECTDLNGYKLRPYDARVFLSKSYRIGVYPLMPRDDDGDEVFDAVEKDKVRDYVESIVLLPDRKQREKEEKKETVIPSYHYNMCMYLLLKSFGGSSLIDPNVSLVEALYQRLGLRLVGGTAGTDMTMRTLLTNRIAVRAAVSNDDRLTKRPRRMFKYGDMIKIKE